MENNVTIKVTRKGYKIVALIDNKKYTQEWTKTLTGSKTVKNDFDKIKDDQLFEALDSVGGGDMYELMKQL